MNDCRSYEQKEVDRGTSGRRCVQVNNRRWIPCSDGETVKTTGETPPAEWDFSVRSGGRTWWFKVLVVAWVAALVKWVLPAVL